MASQAVLLDTDVFSKLYVTPREIAEKQTPRVETWSELLTGRRIVISFQTRAELFAGALIAKWGDRRLSALRGQLDATPTVDVDHEVVEAFARLTAECRTVGHALAAKLHTGDRWVAACAIAKGLPLLAGDGIYANAPGLTLLEVDEA